MEDPTIVTTLSSTIKDLDPNTVMRTLGAFLSPTSEWTNQIEVLKAKMDKLAGRLLTSSLSFDDVRVFYQSIYTPSIRYVLPALSIDERHIEEIQTRSIEALLIRKVSITISLAELHTDPRHGAVSASLILKQRVVSPRSRNFVMPSMETLNPAN